MEKEIYLVRHCEAEGQPFEANLTKRGLTQAKHLSEFFSKIKIDQIISSPFLRAIQSIEPTSNEKKIDIVLDERLSERKLSSIDLPDWLEKLEATFEDLELKFDGGESSQEATNRAMSVIDEIIKSENQITIVVTHGNLMSLILKQFNIEFGFENWKSLRNPDLYLLKYKNNEFDFERLWQVE
ncbi:histidine phosphatase family protein [Gottfriedia acidiceleris]|uniref:Histidine phosphatase family protein n=1 Tax=Gottfriedia acidiceleris TaxID=371036 RepID=A0ABY4JGE5_9BACI|nr:histidine phosphatase family protein [Gottfriedia acidiceleris]UPM52904.1 histidine phosphatase family protein [Gottfriedia acidiceleris]